MGCCSLMFVFFKQKTAYELRISDWSSDVCSSDLAPRHLDRSRHEGQIVRVQQARRAAPELVVVVAVVPVGGLGLGGGGLRRHRGEKRHGHGRGARKSVVSGRSRSVRVDLDGRPTLTQNKKT